MNFQRKSAKTSYLTMAGSESAGASLIKRAVELDAEGRYEEALTFYQTGIEQLLTTLKGRK